MALTPGTRLGAYEIADLIGTGGMGEVYKARDSRLDRFVAIKVLPGAPSAAQGWDGCSSRPAPLRPPTTPTSALSTTSAPGGLKSVLGEIGRIDEARTLAAEALWWLAQAAAYARRDAEAIDIFGRVADAGPGFLSDSALLCRTDEYYPCLIANCLAHVGETDEALTWVEQAISWGFTYHRFLSEHNRFLAQLHGNAGFQRAIQRAQLHERTFQ